MDLCQTLFPCIFQHHRETVLCFCLMDHTLKQDRSNFMHAFQYSGEFTNVYIGETKHPLHIPGTSEDNTLQCKHIQQPENTVLMTDMYTLQRLLNITEKPSLNRGGFRQHLFAVYCSTNTGFWDGIDVGTVPSPTAKRITSLFNSGMCE